MKHIFNKVPGRMATITVALDGGARSEGEKWTPGLAHMMEHMCFKGTTNRNWQEVAREVAFIGGQTNAFTSHEMVCYYIYVPVENIDKAMEILSDQVFNSTIPEEEFLKEWEVVKQEEIGRTDSPTYELNLELTKRVMPGRLATPIIGTKDSISKFTHKELVKYYKKVYTKRNAVVSLAANLSKREGKSLLVKHFGRSSSFKLSAPTYDPPTYESETVIVNKHDLEHAYACICLPGVSMTDSRDNAVAILTQVLGGGMDSRLFTEVREVRGLVYSIGAYDSSQRDFGNIFVSFQTEPSKVDEVIKVIGAELDKMMTEKISDEELTRAKNSIRSSVYSTQDSTMGLAQESLTREMFGMLSLEEDMEDFAATTADDVLAVAKELLSGPRLVVISKSE